MASSTVSPEGSWDPNVYEVGVRISPAIELPDPSVWRVELELLGTRDEGWTTRAVRTLSPEPLDLEVWSRELRALPDVFDLGGLYEADADAIAAYIAFMNRHGIDGEPTASVHMPGQNAGWYDLPDVGERPITRWAGDLATGQRVAHIIYEDERDPGYATPLDWILVAEFLRMHLADYIVTIESREFPGDRPPVKVTRALAVQMWNHLAAGGGLRPCSNANCDVWFRRKRTRKPTTQPKVAEYCSSRCEAAARARRNYHQKKAQAGGAS